MKKSFSLAFFSLLWSSLTFESVDSDASRQAPTSFGSLLVLLHVGYEKGRCSYIPVSYRRELVWDYLSRFLCGAVELAKETRPDVVILDVEMPVMGTQVALGRLLGLSPPPRVIIVTVFADRRLVRELSGLEASAILAKSASSRDLIATVRSVIQNLHEGEDNITVTVPREDFDAEEPTESELSRREMQILRLAACGMGNKEVADALHLSEVTVKHNLSNIYDKLDVHTRGEAVSKAVSEGWISSWDLARDE